MTKNVPFWTGISRICRGGCDLQIREIPVQNGALLILFKTHFDFYFLIFRSIFWDFGAIQKKCSKNPCDFWPTILRRLDPSVGLDTWIRPKRVPRTVWDPVLFSNFLNPNGVRKWARNVRFEPLFLRWIVMNLSFQMVNERLEMANSNPLYDIISKKCFIR